MKALKWVRENLFGILALALVYAVGTWALSVGIEKTVDINRAAAQQCQRMFAESYR